MRKIRCHYPSPDLFVEALESTPMGPALHVHTTDAFEAGEEVLSEVHFPGLPGRMMVRAIGQEWHAARPRLRIRAGGTLLCAGSESTKLAFLKEVAEGTTQLSARRRHIRLPVLVEVRWRRRGETEHKVAALSEISEGGALLLTQGEVAPDENIIIEITPPGSARPLEVQATVRNRQGDEGVGLEFLARDMGGVHRLREVIRRIVEQ